MDVYTPKSNDSLEQIVHDLFINMTIYLGAPTLVQRHNIHQIFLN